MFELEETKKRGKLSLGVYDKLTSAKFEKYITLPYRGAELISTFHNSRYEAEASKKRIISEMYNDAISFLKLSGEKSITPEISEYYGRIVRNCILDFVDSLSEICTSPCQKLLHQELMLLIENTTSHMHTVLCDELSQGYYKFGDKSFYESMADIEVHDYRYKSKNDFFEQMCEFIMSIFDEPQVQYTVSPTVLDVHEKLQDELFEKTKTLYTAAYREYIRYCDKISNALDALEEHIPSNTLDEWMKKISPER